MPDLDVLIDRCKFLETKKQLEKMGYVMDKMEPSEIKELPYAEISFFKSIGKLTITIDVHLIAVRCSFRKFFPAPIEPERMMKLNDELIKKPKRYTEFTILDDTSSLIHLCLNTMIHHAGRGVWEHTRISRLIESRTIDWTRFYKSIIKYDLTSATFFPLMWSNKLFGVMIPGLNEISPNRIKKLLAKLLINRWTVFRLINLNNWFTKKINSSSVLVLRLIISLPDTKSRIAGIV